ISAIEIDEHWKDRAARIIRVDSGATIDGVGAVDSVVQRKQKKDIVAAPELVNIAPRAIADGLGPGPAVEMIGAIAKIDDAEDRTGLDELPDFLEIGESVIVDTLKKDITVERAGIRHFH